MSLSILSALSHFIELRFGDTVLAHGTAFIGAIGDKELLITNRHNVTGRHNDTEKCLSKTGGIPNNMVVWHHKNFGDGVWERGCWTPTQYELTEGEEPQWIEHPTLGAKADFVGIRLPPKSGIWAPAIELAEPSIEPEVTPGETLSVVGYPFGKTAGGKFGIWATGSLASEPDIDQEGLPMFYIDCRTRKGQSGSPVFFHRSGGWVRLTNNTTVSLSKPMWAFKGIYSGRIHPDSDIGRVWKRKAIAELVAAS